MFSNSEAIFIFIIRLSSCFQLGTSDIEQIRVEWHSVWGLKDLIWLDINPIQSKSIARSAAHRCCCDLCCCCIRLRP